MNMINSVHLTSLDDQPKNIHSNVIRSPFGSSNHEMMGQQSEKSEKSLKMIAKYNNIRHAMDKN